MSGTDVWSLETGSWYAPQAHNSFAFRVLGIQVWTTTLSWHRYFVKVSCVILMCVWVCRPYIWMRAKASHLKIRLHVDHLNSMLASQIQKVCKEMGRSALLKSPPGDSHAENPQTTVGGGGSGGTAWGSLLWCENLLGKVSSGWYWSERESSFKQ